MTAAQLCAAVFKKQKRSFLKKSAPVFAFFARKLYNKYVQYLIYFLDTLYFVLSRGMSNESLEKQN
jgi:hypothetical protein